MFYNKYSFVKDFFQMMMRKILININNLENKIYLSNNKRKKKMKINFFEINQFFFFYINIFVYKNKLNFLNLSLKKYPKNYEYDNL